MDTEALLEELRKKLERLQKLEAAFEGSSPAPEHLTPTGRIKKKGAKRNLSPESRKAIGDAQRARWDKIHAAKAAAKAKA
jgi:hypothetical protein